ncbi:MAG: DNA-binding protein Alba [Candidatus Nanoarchaeia archaeon]|nr:DNA-binding protein Alba [Candidatus Nanoarchaeia archaeon]MDD5054563.1 DNA-binding protein Alba [Candidatus Nanoarchaeia archaeon]
MDENAKEKKDNIVFIGNKTPLSYVFAVATQFKAGAKEVIIKARGKLISRAVDVAEILKNKFVEEAKVESIITSTEALKNERGDVNVSVISITLKKK